MSTNYYWIYNAPEPQDIMLPTGALISYEAVGIPDTDIHIGKRYVFAPAKTAFIFAIDPEILLRTLRKKIDHHPLEKIIRDEYERELTAKEFSVLLFNDIRWDINSIGEEFS